MRATKKPYSAPKVQSYTLSKIIGLPANAVLNYEATRCNSLKVKT